MTYSLFFKVIGWVITAAGIIGVIWAGVDLCKATRDLWVAWQIRSKAMKDPICRAEIEFWRDGMTTWQDILEDAEARGDQLLIAEAKKQIAFAQKRLDLEIMGRSIRQ